MGLDTYAVYPKGHHKNNDNESCQTLPSELFPPNNLCGGMFSGGGNSFRGKVYNSLVEEVTGISLYNEMIPAEDVKLMVTRIEDHISKTKDEDPNLLELLGWFQVVVKEEACISGWW